MRIGIFGSSCGIFLNNRFPFSQKKSRRKIKKNSVGILSFESQERLWANDYVGYEPHVV